MKNCYLPLLALSFVFGGCDQPEPIPAYLNIQSVDIQGFPDQNFSHVWVYADLQLLGAFPLPATIPVIANGQTEIQVFPGVDENGDYLTPNIYPFFKKLVQNFNLVPGETTVVQPVLSYDLTAKQPLIEDFENGTHQFTNDNDLDLLTKMEVQMNGGVANSKAGKITLDTAHRIFESRSPALLGLPLDRPVWLEISYKADFKFHIGLAGSVAGGVESSLYFQQIFPKTGWTKMYVNLTDAIKLTEFDTYKIGIRAELPVDANGKFELLNGSIWLDNIRLIHF